MTNPGQSLGAAWSRFLLRLPGRRRARPAGSGRQVFIDGGGYDGCSARKWLRTHPGCEVVSFEPNPLFAPYYRDVPGQLIQSAVWTRDGRLTLHLDGEDYDGSSVYPDKPTTVPGGTIEVPCVDLSRWIGEHIGERDDCTLKLDIEGAEYAVLERLIETGAIRRISALYVEFHWRKLGQAIGRRRHRDLVSRLRALGLPPRRWNALGDRTLVRWPAQP